MKLRFFTQRVLKTGGTKSGEYWWLVVDRQDYIEAIGVKSRQKARAVAKALNNVKVVMPFEYNIPISKRM